MRARRRPRFRSACTDEFRVAVVGATGLVGETMISVLEERDFPVAAAVSRSPATARSAAVSSFRGRSYPVRRAGGLRFRAVRYRAVLRRAAVSREYAPQAAAAGCIVIDNTSEFRYREDVPLVVPEVNPQAIAQYRQRAASSPIRTARPSSWWWRSSRSTTPPASSASMSRPTSPSPAPAGRRSRNWRVSRSRLLSGKGPVEPARRSPSRSPSTACRTSMRFEDNGYTREEMKMVWETRKILGRSCASA